MTDCTSKQTKKFRSIYIISTFAVLKLYFQCRIFELWIKFLILCYAKSAYICITTLRSIKKTTEIFYSCHKMFQMSWINWSKKKEKCSLHTRIFLEFIQKKNDNRNTVTRKKYTKLSYGRNVQETFCPNRIKRKVEICRTR